MIFFELSIAKNCEKIDKVLRNFGFDCSKFAIFIREFC